MKELDDREFLDIVKSVHKERIKNNYYNPFTIDEFEEDIDFDNVSFGDLMLDVAKSEDEALIQKANDFIDIVYQEAEKQYIFGKSRLLTKVQKEGYTIINNQRKVIDYVVCSHSISSVNISSKFASQIRELMTFCKKEYNQDKNKLIIKPMHQEVLDIYMYWISQLGKKDNIKITCHFSNYDIVNNSELELYDLPCEITCSKQNKNYSYYGSGIILRFEYTLPEKYSLEYQKKIQDEKKKQITENEIDSLLNSFDVNTILEKIDNMDGYVFENFCAKLLASNGYTNVYVTSGSRDQGIDIIAHKDKIKFGIQCKCYSTDVGNSAVQEANAGRMFYNCNVGVVLTNRFFTVSAVDLAESIGIVLWDRSSLEDLIKNSQT